jgi:hypothetical protein
MNGDKPVLGDILVHGDDIYKKIHISIQCFPSHTTDFHATKLNISSFDFDRITRIINTSPNSFWPLGPFKKNKVLGGWCIDYANKKGLRTPTGVTTPLQENIILRSRIATLETELETLR